jgi:hypothetical protein
MYKNDGIKWFLLVVAVVGIGIRLSLVQLGHNYDFDSFLIVARLDHFGANVYANTVRYNYGPIWFYLLHIFDSIAHVISSEHDLAFRYILVFFLSLVDVGIAGVLWKKLNSTAAVVFFLSPISIIITGYHNQFDNLALLLGLLSVIIIGNNFDKPLTRRTLCGLGVLGLSLLTKHILFAFPVWLAAKQQGVCNKLIVILLPILIFGAGFIPFWNEGKDGIIRNVFLYKSLANDLFYRLFVPWSIQLLLSSTIVWLLLLAIFAVIFRNKGGFETLLLYTCVVTMASPAIANQYLAIPVPFTSANMNLFSYLYTTIGTFHLLVDIDGLHIPLLQQIINVHPDFYYGVLVSLLFFEVVWLTWHNRITIFFHNVGHEIAAQLER